MNAPARSTSPRTAEGVNPHRAQPVSVLSLVRSFIVHRHLIWQLTRRDVAGRYRGSAMGLAWSFLTPLIMLAIYTFVFSVVFKARWGAGVDDTTAGFALVLFVGLIVHGLFAEGLTRGPGLVLANTNYVKRVIFPLDVLAWVAVGSALFHSAISLVVLLVAEFAIKGAVPWTVVFLPLVFVPLILGTLGITWFLASLGVFVRDISQLTPMLVSITMFLSPVFYPVSAISSPAARRWIYLNPLTSVIEDARNAIIFGRRPNLHHWLAVFALSLVAAQLGYWWFQRTRKGFADVM